MKFFATLIIFCFSINTFANELISEKHKNEVKKLQGKWEIQSLEIAGKLSKQVKGMAFTIKGNQLIIPTNGGAPMIATYTVSPEKEPKQLTFIINDEIGDKLINNSIYQITGDELKLCFISANRPGISHPFPKTFKTDKSMPMSALFIFKRVKE